MTEGGSENCTTAAVMCRHGTSLSFLGFDRTKFGTVFSAVRCRDDGPLLLKVRAPCLGQLPGKNSCSVNVKGEQKTFTHRLDYSGFRPTSGLNWVLTVPNSVRYFRRFAAGMMAHFS